MKETKTEIESPCPACGKQQTFSKKAWMETFHEEEVWDGRKKEYRTTPGPNEILECVHCGAEVAAIHWHRAAEREYFEAHGWKTPRMMKELGT